MNDAEYANALSSKRLFLPGQPVVNSYYRWGHWILEPVYFHQDNTTPIPGTVRLRLPNGDKSNFGHAICEFMPLDNEIEVQVYPRDLDGVLHIGGKYTLNLHHSWKNDVWALVMKEYVEYLEDTPDIFIQMCVYNALQWQSPRYFTFIRFGVPWTGRVIHRFNDPYKEWMRLFTVEAQIFDNQTKYARLETILDDPLDRNLAQIQKDDIMELVNNIPNMSVSDEWGNTIEIEYIPKEIVYAQRFEEYTGRMGAYLDGSLDDTLPIG